MFSLFQDSSDTRPPLPDPAFNRRCSLLASDVSLFKYDTDKRGTLSERQSSHQCVMLVKYAAFFFLFFIFLFPTPTAWNEKRVSSTLNRGECCCLLRDVGGWDLGLPAGSRNLAARLFMQQRHDSSAALEVREAAPIKQEKGIKNISFTSVHQLLLFWRLLL